MEKKAINKVLKPKIPKVLEKIDLEKEHICDEFSLCYGIIEDTTIEDIEAEKVCFNGM